MTAPSMPMWLRARISASPLNRLKTGAPWKQSPESSHSDREPLARSRLMMVDMRDTPPNGPFWGSNP
jgi:hypothetical protein